jgi:hypothetical protein
MFLGVSAVAMAGSVATEVGAGSSLQPQCVRSGGSCEIQPEIPYEEVRFGIN